jgi:excisionase family DNA binding protein
MSHLMSVTALAEYLDIPEATIYRWRSTGYGPVGFRVGKHLRYRREDVDAWIEAQRDRETVDA